MPSRLTGQLTREHVELPALLPGCVLPGGAVDLRRFDEFRHRALRHLAIEELVLIPALARRLGHRPMFQNGLRKDHAAIVALCVPTPNPDWVKDLGELLAYHNAVEESPGGFYALLDALKLADDPRVTQAIEALPPLELPPFASGHQLRAQLHAVMRATGASRED